MIFHRPNKLNLRIYGISISNITISILLIPNCVYGIQNVTKRVASTLKKYNWIFNFSFQSVSTPQAMRRRLLKYFIPVLVMSLAFNIPKWFECYVDWEVVSNTTVVHQFNQTANQSSFEIVSKISFSNPSTNNILNKNNACFLNFFRNVCHCTF